MTVTNAEGTTTIALTEVQDMYFSNEAGGSEMQPGDVNMDGSVNIADVTVLIDYLLSSNASNVNLTAADVDGDGDVNIADVTQLIDMLLGND